MPLKKEPLVKPLSPEECDPETRAILQAAINGPDGAPLNIFATLAHHPKLLKRWLVFGNHVLSKSTIGARERELLILRTGWLCRAEYEWGQHVIIARQVGVTDEEIRRIRKGPEAGWDPFDAALLRAADELHSDQTISDTTWRELAERYDTRQLIDVVFTVGQYTLVSMALNTLGVQRDAGVPGFEE
jgi:4-carboxymuconolactone decarboxylase